MYERVKIPWNSLYKIYSISYIYKVSDNNRIACRRQVERIELSKKSNTILRTSK